ncbi:hypothetical protein RDI58_019097 [Solanum bulbocastanum]|uniref:Uncharacterized protein n=1 Tax=Solanum bulbocastanum TaxID=147425 RepID=A0AAN8TI43_SOLBU
MDEVNFRPYRPM